jgi:hypothetical protein
LTWANPPKDIPTQTYYRIIKNFSNNFSFAKTYLDSLNGNKVVLNSSSNNEFEISMSSAKHRFSSQKHSFIMGL